MSKVFSEQRVPILACGFEPVKTIFSAQKSSGSTKA
jgi:hypothetical protein